MRSPDPDRTYPSIAAFAAARPDLPAGVIAILLCESPLHAAASARRLADAGAAAILALGETGAMGALACPMICIDEAPTQTDAVAKLNALIDALAGRWLVWLWNGEFLVFPYCETRRLTDLTQFLSDERRRSLYCYALDLYADDMPPPDAPPDSNPLWFDAEGYHAFPEPDQGLTIYGGLGWRFEEFAPPEMAQLGRTSLFRAATGVHFGPDLGFADPEYASISCPWHHNPTGAVMSLRRTRRVLAHPGFAARRGRLMWNGSRRFEWSSEQLLELGMIEPGQWF